ncbi:MAG TPA: class I SAM-dependent methyltransferase [Vicinamibacterales bacterium]|nr:class I SAM-dependent methyltransferase [Vicinamibacterales bacterium]
MSDIALEPGSFRDRTARVFYHDGKIFRGLNETALKEWQALSATSFFRRFSGSGAIVPTQQRDLASLPLSSTGQQWAGVLEHEKLPFVSYPYEWSFEMLRDAALLQLDLVLAGLEEGIGLKDASAYNLQWKGASPVFVDVASFYTRAEGEPWVGYRQFCQMFLYPLLLQAYRDVPFQPWMRGNIDGMDAEVCLNLLSARDYVRAGVLAHVYLQAKAQKAYNATTRDVRKDLTKAGFDKRIIKTNAEGLRALVAGLQWKPKQSTWSDYLKCGHYEASDAEQKREFVRGVAGTRDRSLAWDIGCNVGVFSRILAERTTHVVAMDLDHLAIDKLYLALKAEKVTNILPLVVNVTDPSPNLGWRNMERKRIDERGRPELILALALIHHVVIGGNIPMAEFVQWLRDLGGELVIEFVTRKDPMVVTLLRNKEDHYTDYDEDVFERELAARFRIAKRQPLGSGTRIMYHAQ